MNTTYKKIHLLIVGLILLSSQLIAQSKSPVGDHPRLFVSNKDWNKVQKKIKEEKWADQSWKNLTKQIDVYVNRHKDNPEWIISRLAMYWKEGERYTQCYIKKQNWDYGTGNAPVPTVRLPGMRVWNDFRNVPLEDRILYNESGDMKAISRSLPDQPAVIVPYKKSGHLIRQNNEEILALAEKSAFAYWVTKEEKYAKFASDIYVNWLLGVYYMNPPLDPEKSTGGVGGYAPGGIMGYYDYEVIHDGMQVYAATIYDFLHDYLLKNQNKNIKSIGKSITEISGEVFKRFINIGLVRGGKKGNWNVNGLELIHRSILVLESNNFYIDGKGKEYYLPFYTHNSTIYHDALPDILKFYDPITGLWPESPGYATGTIASIINMGLPIYKNGVNTISGNPIIQKAALANLDWLDAKGNLVVFGDMRGGPLNYAVYDKLLTYYTLENDTANIKIMTAVVQKGINNAQYNRDNSDWIGITLNVPLPKETSPIPYSRTAYSEEHRHLIQKNGNDENMAMMFTLYGGEKGKHLSPNGLAMQLYGKGWALAPDASAYESYWSANSSYHQSAIGSNTILPGYVAGNIKINAIDPAPGLNSFTNKNTTSEYCSFADITAQEKRRLVAMVRTSENTGYYVDIFRSNLENNDYLYHNLGDKTQILDMKGEELELIDINAISSPDIKEYSYFENVRKVAYDDAFKLRFTITNTQPKLNLDMWMLGQKNREIYLVDAPPTTLIDGVTPNGANKSPHYTPAVIVRQQLNNAQINPFVAVFEGASDKGNCIQEVRYLKKSENFVSISVSSNNYNKEIICNAIDDQLYHPLKDLDFKGIFGIVSENKDGFSYLYLGKGKLIKKGNYKIEAVTGEVSAELILKNGKLFYSSDAPVKITLKKGKAILLPSGYNLQILDK